MLERLPRRIDYYRYTDKEVILEGILSQTELSRLSDIVADNSGKINYRLEFGVDYLSIRFAKGWIKTQLIQQCQRCLGNYTQNLESNIAVAFVHTDYEIERAEEAGYEAYFLNDKQWVEPRLIIEEEVLLAIPIIPSHQEGDKACQVNLEYPTQTATIGNSSGSISDTTEGQGDSNPFAVLKNLKI